MAQLFRYKLFFKMSSINEEDDQKSWNFSQDSCLISENILQEENKKFKKEIDCLRKNYNLLSDQFHEMQKLKKRHTDERDKLKKDYEKLENYYEEVIKQLKIENAYLKKHSKQQKTLHSSAFKNKQFEDLKKQNTELWCLLNKLLQRADENMIFDKDNLLFDLKQKVLKIKENQDKTGKRIDKYIDSDRRVKEHRQMDLKQDNSRDDLWYILRSLRQKTKQIGNDSLILNSDIKKDSDRVEVLYSQIHQQLNFMEKKLKN